jgi:hydroxyacylglutathione hydrolase
MRSLRFAGLALLVAWMGWAAPAFPGSGDIRDAESASHGSGAARYETTATYTYPGFRLIQFNLAVLSHYSYLLISGDECLVVDPGRDADIYVETAKRENAKIVGVWLSHSHADFIAGHAELASLGVPVWVSGQAGAKYEHRPLEDGSTLTVGEANLKFLATPGHTPDGMCALVSRKGETEKPLVLLSGDTLFVGSVGRPDLMGEGMSASTLAAMMFDSWTKKLSRLPDDVRILPAHGAGSLCGAHLSDEPSGTIGEQRIANPYFQHKSRGAFIAAVLDGLPDAPQYFKHNAAANREGPEKVDWEAEAPIAPATEELTDTSRHYVVDIREAKEYAAGHVPNSVNIALRGRFETWVGIMIPWGSNLVLTGDPKMLKEAVGRLHRVGYQPRCLPFDDWVKAGLPLNQNNMCDPRALHAAMQTPESPIIIDVRLPAEWMALRIGTVVNIPLNELAAKARKIDRSEKVVTVCNSAYRSSMAVGVLERQGFEKVCSMAGGGEAWIDAGLPVFEARKPGGAPASAKRYVRLADRLSASELKRMLMDVPGSFTLVDIRPPAHFADFRLPGAENVDLADLLDNPAWLVGIGPLIIVDRDGSLAMMVAGILSQKTERPIKALYGGLAGYWEETGLEVPSGAPVAPDLTPPASSPADPAAQPEKRKKSAGC